ncbi:MAG: FAD-binding protein, partial [Beijerinckiaceae bacterium]
GRIADITRQFEDFRQIESAGAVKTADNAAQLARLLHLPPEAFAATFAHVQQAMKSPSAPVDQFGRSWQNIMPLQPPYYAVRVTGALFHTQGGLVVDDHARVLKNNGTPFVNLLAAGGAAVGISGRQASGYLSGNGLATAVAYGFIGGQSAACVGK